MQILVIILLLAIIAYAFAKLSSVKKESEQKGKQIADLLRENAQLKSEISTLEKEKRSLENSNASLKLHNEALSKYQDIIDVNVECDYMKKKAEKEIQKLKDLVAQDLILSQNQAKENRRISKELAERKANEIQQLYENAFKESKRILENAETKAEAIGGDAYRSLREADQIAERIKAMKNIIKGYGNEFIISNYTILDNLAEEYSHKEAGENLKKLRQNNRSMIISRQAGICDYVDEARRNIAIDFVIDAYNGKIDSLLATVKTDNYGILKQKMDDAFQVVNYNGKGFRNARISEIYHSARIEELKWAVIVQELRLKELEEQREIREQIREEEKARRDFEKAMKEAEKEEQTLKKLIEKAQLQVAKANEEQKAAFLLQLQELQGKLETAEEKSKRALSMAQQTRTGNVYIISNIGSFGEDVFKIGMTRRLEPLDRVRELGDASVPFEFDVHAMIYSEDAPALERMLHKQFLKNQVNKINPRKEFFRLGINDMKNYLESQNIQCKWTLKAEAKQFRETKKLEEDMKADKQLENEWKKYQEVVDPVSFEQIAEEVDSD